jgi:hypothetical protein
MVTKASRGRKKYLQSRMRVIQRVLEEVDSTRLLLLHNDLLQEYEDVLFQGRNIMVLSMRVSFSKGETLWF